MAGREIKAQKCPACGAGLPAIAAGTRQITCKYCGINSVVTPARFGRSARVAAATRVSHGAGGPEVAVTGTSAGRGSGCAVLTVVLLVTLGIGAAVYFTTLGTIDTVMDRVDEAQKRALSSGQTGTEAIDRQLAGIIHGPGGIAAVQARGAASAGASRTPRWGFLDQYSRPVADDVDGDGVDDLLALFVEERGGALSVYAGAFDGKDLAEKWRVGPFGSRKECTRKLVLAVGVSRLAVVGPFGRARVYEKREGTPLVTLTLDKNPDYRDVCGPDRAHPEVDRVWLEGRQAIDLGEARLIRVKRRPRRCGRRGAVRQTDSARLIFSAPLSQRPARSAPKFARFESKAVLAQGGDGVVFLVNKVGRPQLLAVGFDAATRAERWRRPVAELTVPVAQSDDELPPFREVFGGHLLLGWVAADGRARLASADVSTGAPEWGREIEALPSTWTFKGQRLWVVYLHWPLPPLELIDLGTGARLGRLGP